MSRRILLSLSVLALWTWASLAQAPKAEEKKPAAVKAKSSLKVTVPQDNAELLIEKTVMKTGGTVREFDTPELEGGAVYEYEFVVKWEPNNYTKLTRTKVVKFKGGEAVEVDLTKPDPATDKAVIRYVPTPDDIVKKMLDMAKVGKEDTVFDLGCGDGRLVIAAAKAGAKKGVGIDLDDERVKESKANVDKAKLSEKVEIKKGDLLEADLSSATVVLMYLSDELGAIIEAKLKKDLKPGTRVVSHRFTIGGWKPDETVKVKGEDGEEYTLHIWTVK